jgi:HEAT repeat protein
MTNVFEPYEIGLRRLLELLGSDHPDNADLLLYQQRLRENILKARKYGDTDTLKHERAQIVDALNRLTREATQTTFTGLCGPYPPIHYFVHRSSWSKDYNGPLIYAAELTDWLEIDEPSLLAVIGPSGVGKSALVWNWASTIWERENLIGGLFGWSFTENPNFTEFVQKALIYTSGGEYVPDGSESITDLCKALLNQLENSSTLLILDGFEQLLTVYDNLSAQMGTVERDQVVNPSDLCQCTSPAASYLIKNLSRSRSKILLTSRLLPQVLYERDNCFSSDCQIIRFPKHFDWLNDCTDLPLKRETITILRTFRDLDPRFIEVILSVPGIDSFTAVLGIQASHERTHRILGDEDFVQFTASVGWFLPPVRSSVAASLARALIRTAELLDNRNIVVSVFESLFERVEWSSLRLSKFMSLLTLFYITVLPLFRWRVFLVNALGQLRVKETSSFLAQQLENRRPAVRKAAALALCYTGQTPQATWCLVEKLKSDPKAKVRAACAEALGYSASTMPVDALVSSLDDPAKLVRYRATESLGWIGDHKVYDILMSKGQEWSEKILTRHRGEIPMSVVACEAAEQIKQRSLKDESARRSPLVLPPEQWITHTIEGAGLV